MFFSGVQNQAGLSRLLFEQKKFWRISKNPSKGTTEANKHEERPHSSFLVEDYLIVFLTWVSTEGKELPNVLSAISSIE